MEKKDLIFTRVMKVKRALDLDATFVTVKVDNMALAAAEASMKEGDDVVLINVSVAQSAERLDAIEKAAGS